MPISGEGGEGASYGTIWGEMYPSKGFRSAKALRGRMPGDRRNSSETCVPTAAGPWGSTRRWDNRHCWARRASQDSRGLLLSV